MPKPGWSRIDRRALLTVTVAGTLLLVFGSALSYQVDSSCPPDTLCEHYLFETIPIGFTGKILSLIGAVVLIVFWVLYFRLKAEGEVRLN